MYFQEIKLHYILFRTFRYSTMLAENLVDNYKPVQQDRMQDHLSIKHKEVDEDGTDDSPELSAGK